MPQCQHARRPPAAGLSFVLSRHAALRTRRRRWPPARVAPAGATGLDPAVIQVVDSR